MADDQQRLNAAESLAQNLDRPMGILGIIFLLVVLAIFSVVVFATLAGTIGAYFLRRDPVEDPAARASGASSETGPLRRS